MAACLDQRLGFRQLIQSCLGAGGICLPQFCQTKPTRAPFNEAYSEPLFKVSKRFADSRLGHSKLARCRADSRSAGDFDKDADLIIMQRLTSADILRLCLSHLTRC